MKQRFVQIPSDPKKDNTVTPLDLFVYGIIKKHWNKDRNDAYPSLKTISEEAGLAINTIRKCIKNLEGKYFKIEQVPYKNTVQNRYIFTNNFPKFEQYSFEFLEKKDLTPTEKGVIIAEQPFMYTETKDLGKISYNYKQLSQKINMPETSLYKTHNALKTKGYLQIMKTNTRDPETGSRGIVFYYDLGELCQQIAWTFRKQEQEIENLKEETQQITETIVSIENSQTGQQNEIKDLKKDMERLTKAVLNTQKNQKILMNYIFSNTNHLKIPK